MKMACVWCWKILSMSCKAAVSCSTRTRLLLGPCTGERGTDASASREQKTQCAPPERLAETNNRLAASHLDVQGSCAPFRWQCSSDSNCQDCQASLSRAGTAQITLEDLWNGRPLIRGWKLSRTTDQCRYIVEDAADYHRHLVAEHPVSLTMPLDVISRIPSGTRSTWSRCRDAR